MRRFYGFRHFAAGRLALLMAALAILAALAGEPANAQYQVFAWENFEQGALPESLKLGHDATPDHVAVFDFRSPGAPAGITAGVARTEVGNYGLHFKTTEKNRFLSVVSRLELNREQLGASGRALYQADFYLPESLDQFSNVAVLAVAPDDQGAPSNWRIYRLGILDAKNIYFSFTNNQSQPLLYKQESLDLFQLQRPGWHRLQIIFEGRDKIWCCVNGKPTSFSPIEESTFDRLMAGIMVTSPAERPCEYFADNLSIQWTPQDVPLPDSPWLAGAAPTGVAGLGADSSAATRLPTAPGALAPAAAPASGGGVWLTDPDQAWNLAVQKQRPLLALFLAPRVVAAQQLEQSLMSDPAAQTLPQEFVALRVDVNQLQGGSLAQRLGVYRVPCFLVFGLDGQVKARVLYERTSSLAQVTQQLRQTLPAAP